MNKVYNWIILAFVAVLLIMWGYAEWRFTWDPDMDLQIALLVAEFEGYALKYILIGACLFIGWKTLQWLNKWSGLNF
jgi:hypothetical protein